MTKITTLSKYRVIRLLEFSFTTFLGINESKTQETLSASRHICQMTSFWKWSLWPHSFSSFMERAERFWRHNDVIWQLVKLWFSQITSS